MSIENFPIEKIPSLDQITAMCEYTEARIEMEPNPLGVILLKNHLRIYCLLADRLLDNVTVDQ